MKTRLLSLLMALCLLALTACADPAPVPDPPTAPTAPATEAVTEAATEATTSAPETTAPTEAATEPATEPITDPPVEEPDLDAFLAGLALWEEPGRTYTFVRDDIGLRIPAAPVRAESLVKCLREMELRPFGEGQAALPLSHPFSLLAETNGAVDTIALTAGKVTVNGVDYSPANPALLADFLVNEHERFLTGDPFLLQTEMPFTDDEIAEVRLTELENYSAGETEVITKSRADISRIAKGLNQAVVRRYEPGEGPSIYVGGNAYHCALTLADGGTWSMDYTGNATVTSAEGTYGLEVFALDQDAVFGLLERNDALPQPVATIEGGATPTVYETSFLSLEAAKTRSSLIPDDARYDRGTVLVPSVYGIPCQLDWVDELGRTPIRVAVTSHLDIKEGRPNMTEVEPSFMLEELDVTDGTILLPGGEGRYYVTVEAEFEGDVAARYVFAYRVSMFPDFFYDIEFGNAEGDVLLVRNDVAASVRGSQNRKYVDFVLGLGLLPAPGGGPQRLPVWKPFTMSFHSGGSTYAIRFTAEDGVTVSYHSAEKQSYTVAYPKVIESIYASIDSVDPGYADPIDLDLRGFLTKDVAYFTGAFPFAPSDIAGFQIIRHEPDRNITYDCGDLSPDGIMEILGSVVLGRQQSAEDAYIGQFTPSYSYNLTLADGTFYAIGALVFTGDEDTGWYVIQSDTSLPQQVTANREPIPERNDPPAERPDLY